MSRIHNVLPRVMDVVRNRVRDDRGDVSLFVLTMATIIMALATLIVDGGARIKAATRADTYSAEAARAASIGIGADPTGGTADTAAATRAANAFLAQAGIHGSATVTGPARVQVTVQITAHGPITGVAFTVTRTHTAELQVGVTNGEAP
jgi:hypothetical protein